MPYCVYCGVELDPSARSCPLCGTPVSLPRQGDPALAAPVFPQIRQEVEPVVHKELAILLTAMFLSAGACCALINLIFPRPGLWWPFVAGGCGVLWVWLVPPLLVKRPRPPLLAGAGLLSIMAYLCLIAALTGGQDWLTALALPVWAGGALLVMLLVCLVTRRSFLGRLLWLIGGFGCYMVWLEFWIDRYLGGYHPEWSLIAGVVCAAFMVPLAVIRLRPGLRGQVRRRFHF